LELLLSKEDTIVQRELIGEGWLNMKKELKKKEKRKEKSKATCSSCGKSYPIARALLGYDTCTGCGEAQANKIKEQRKERVAVLYNKGGYQYINSPDDIGTIGKK
jgi:ribosomal protein L37AE/L43A